MVSWEEFQFEEDRPGGQSDDDDKCNKHMNQLKSVMLFLLEK